MCSEALSMLFRVCLITSTYQKKKMENVPSLGPYNYDRCTSWWRYMKSPLTLQKSSSCSSSVDVSSSNSVWRRNVLRFIDMSILCKRRRYNPCSKGQQHPLKKAQCGASRKTKRGSANRTRTHPTRCTLAFASFCSCS